MRRTLKVAAFYIGAATALLLLLDRVLGTERPVLSLAAVAVLWAAVATAFTLRDVPQLNPFVNAILALAIVWWLIVGVSDLADSRHTLMYGVVGVASYFSSEIIARLRKRRPPPED